MKSRVFPGQGEAIAFAKAETERDAAVQYSVFAAELDRSGRRQFIVCHWKKLWSVTQDLRPDRKVAFALVFCRYLQELPPLY